jgi:hypothetical protein
MSSTALQSSVMENTGFRMAAVLSLAFALAPDPAVAAIDRHALVTRHNVVLTQPDAKNPLSVGNGEFAFTADITGLQTFPDFHETGMPLGTESQWGWHSFPNTNSYRLEETFKEYDVNGRKVAYAETSNSNPKPAAAWLRANPHRIDLGRIGLLLRRQDGQPVQPSDLVHPRQTLDLWSGVLESTFEFEGRPVRVWTVCHPDLDLLAVRIESLLLANSRAGITLGFPYARGDWEKNKDWDHPDRHQTTMTCASNRFDFERIMEATRYHVAASVSKGGAFTTDRPHQYVLCATNQPSLDLVIAFSPAPVGGALPGFDSVLSASVKHWKDFWKNGGAIDLSGSADERWRELERRIVLSQYLTAIQCSGSMPPQETGLVCNSWFGKAHLEMHWWHAAHFALWGRVDLLERSLPWYDAILPQARELARRQGYQGARWPKMVGPDGMESPSGIAPFLIWQQPHPIYFAELCYRANPSTGTLKRFRSIVYESADFMASYPAWDADGKRYVLGPPIIPAQETYGNSKARIFNPTFELAYWYWGLEIAQQWRLRLGEGGTQTARIRPESEVSNWVPTDKRRNPEWDRVQKQLSHPTVRGGVYTAIETPPYTIADDHPSMVAALGVLPRTPLIETDIMRRTLDQVFETWNWPDTWGWDYPMLAMTAARVGRPDKAIDALLIDTPKNKYEINGHNYQRPGLVLYLPGNGGLLSAVAMMAAGWDGAPRGRAPGFPKDGKWVVRWEGLEKMP